MRIIEKVQEAVKEIDKAKDAYQNICKQAFNQYLAEAFQNNPNLDFIVILGLRRRREPKGKHDGQPCQGQQ